jgi:hypothetical protein
MITIFLTVVLFSKNKNKPILLSSSVLEYKTLNCTPKWTIFYFKLDTKSHKK